MHLKSLTLRGFKSFASSTTLHFEPGITCVVGPNGSGKSNVVDALAWVMGEQGAKSLRGGKMEDVIFAGTTGRAALGRAEVLLTIDNTDGALPIEYSEVTISRTMFRNGGSEYSINGQSCRLLDVQELLSDSGIGREMHVIVGQGQLDSILGATPEGRRGFIEEAAGVLKHRKRKEKALRKLEAMEGNLTRLQDLTSEVRRQLGPLGKQAALARRAATIQADLRDARLRLLADDLVQARASLEQEVADEAALKARQAELTQSLEQARAAEARLESEVKQAEPVLARAQDAWYRLSSLRERINSTLSLARERGRHLTTAEEPASSGRDPEEMEAEAAAVREQESEISEQIENARATLDAAIAERSEAEDAAAAEEQRLADLTRAAADRRAGAARLAGEVEGLRSRAAAAESELNRLKAARAEAQERATAAESEFTSLETTIAGLSTGEEGLDAEHEEAAAELAAAEEALAEIVENERAAERERATLAARKEALEMGLARKDGSSALLAASDRVSGILGSVAALLTVEPGWEATVATALGTASDAVAVGSVDDAVNALRLLHDEDLGQAGLLVGGAPFDDPGSWHGLPAGMRYVVDLVTAPAELQPALTSLLRNMVAVDDLPAARALVAEYPDLCAVTRAGDLLGRGRAYGGSSNTQSLLEVQSAVDEAADQLAEATARAERLQREKEQATRRRDEAQARETAALNKLHESDAELSATAEQLGRLGDAVRAANEEAERLTASIAEAEDARDRDLAKLAEMEERLATAEEASDPDDEPSTEERDRLAEQVRLAQQRETEARLSLRTGEERARALAGRAESLERAAREERANRERAEAMARKRARQAEICAAVARGSEMLLRQVEESLEVADAERQTAEQTRAERNAALAEERERTRTIATELEEVTSTVHRDELARAEHRMRVESLETKAREEMGVEPDTLVDEYGPHLEVPVFEAPDQAGKGQQKKRKAAGGNGAAGASGNGVPEGAPDGVAEGSGESGDAPADGEPGDDGTGSDGTGGDEPDGDGAGERPSSITQPVAEPQRYVPFVRDEQEKRARTAERELNKLGKVNPLALEEYAALEERHAFLNEQLEDLKRTRKDLMDIVKEVDDRVQQVFTEAFEDTAREFATVFSRLFPGGEGKLVLTEPDDMLTTGIDVEARPPGKKVKRLSLLSGGERSLVAVAFLVALFKARPSPFYILDEVEAALDDTNLSRLLGLYEELREHSQLIVITHQKRTMEIADALYGVSMRGDGVTAVISQRLRESEPA
ncbi:chromosome segregation protein SMC [Actinobacteria bacterium YIM 96077]|uniref:Chromosome partition protein Smc n=1 Tax=Phytoactinopolyspora halophila TaxID=1981511 RepID=A0A329QDV0_9ACTN|nr:chromosome segregation protein SMC [Phytoactinopolyspora halophila]AYY12709.1 chromosome segregation protein SMC [Actinobacteria bacterium YIM 96077]RAW10623.1 chromosome segregation protein SMC [Phytoactinopolyspora halophila]